FGAVCPERGAGAALVLPACNTEAMQLHLDEIATKITPGAHAILLLDQAGWHGAKALKVPTNISLLQLPPTPARTQRPRKCLAIHAAELAIETEFSNPSTTSSITAATPGTRSSISHGKSCPSHAAFGQPQVIGGSSLTVSQIFESVPSRAAWATR